MADDTADAGILAALDFQPSVQQCECRGKCGHHLVGDRCQHVAMFYTKIHAFGFCQQPGLDNGFAVHVVCAPCMMHNARLAAHLVEASHRTHAKVGGFLQCTACHIDLTNVHEIWEARPLTDVI